MHAGRHYTFSEIVRWTRRETLWFAGVGIVPVLVHEFGVSLPPIPWAPIAALGTAVAFITGFKSNAAYDRLWEGRKIWGAIVNASRTWAVLARDFVRDEAAHGALVHRHVAWLTALRHQLRQPRVWETSGLRHNVEYQKRSRFQIPERVSPIEEDLRPFLSEEDHATVLAAKNRASAVLSLQSAHLRALSDAGSLTEYRHVALARLIEELFTQQGKAERIKNFPYPRQFATLNRLFVWIFILMLPVSVLSEFEKFGDGWSWFTVPVTMLVAWVFHTMDKIGSSSENPFEGGPNDVPITAMSRGIEIDVRELVRETDLPPARTPEGHILM